MGMTSLDALVDWARGENDVLAVVLTGSRARPDPDLDGLSDYDVLLYLRDPEAFAASDAWLERFGSVLVSLRDGYQLDGSPVTTRLVQYDDGTKIDFTLCGPAHLDRLCRREELPDGMDAGYRVLVDEDDRLADLPAPGGDPVTPARPTAEAYRETVDEFWWETLYVAKNLARGELLPARYSAESILRFRCLVPMLEWSVEAGHGWDLPIGPYGRRLRDHLPEAWRAGLDRTYFGADAEKGWDALFAMVELFEAAAEDVADGLGFEYPAERARKVVERLRGIRDGAETRNGGAL